MQSDVMSEKKSSPSATMRNEVFAKMRQDKIGLVVQNDMV